MGWAGKLVDVCCLSHCVMLGEVLSVVVLTVPLYNVSGRLVKPVVMLPVPLCMWEWGR